MPYAGFYGGELMNNKQNKKEYGKYILENKQAILSKKKKLKSIRRGIFCIIIMTSILVTLCFNLDYFDIGEIGVVGNSTLTSEEVVKLSELSNGNNIFKFQSTSVKNKVLRNPYILDIKIERKLPNIVNLIISERKAMFYVQYDDSFYIVDSNAVVLEKRSSIEGMNLAKIEGVDLSAAKIGEVLPLDNEEKKKAIRELCDFVYSNNAIGSHVVSAILLNDLVDIKVLVDKAEIKLGTSEDMKEKLSKAFSILSDEQFKGFNGYVDVSFKGNPVIYKRE